MQRQFLMRAAIGCLALVWAGCGSSGGGDDAATVQGGTLGATTGGQGGFAATSSSTAASAGPVSTTTSGPSGTNGATVNGSSTGQSSLTGGDSATGTGGSGGTSTSSTSAGGEPGDVELEIEEGALTLWYEAPARVWNEALPIGNGRLGAMVFGEPGRERLQLNESSFWSGGPSRNDNPQALGALDDVRQLIFDGAHSEAESLINQRMTATQLHGSMFQPIGDVSLEFPGHQSYSAYHRELDLKRAVFTARYEVGGVTYTREAFASQPDQVLVVRLSADQPGQLDFSVDVDGPLATATGVLGSDGLEMSGRSSSHEGVTGQVEFNARVKVKASGGATTTTASGVDVSDADEALILISIATNFVDYQTLGADEAARSAGYLEAAQGKSYDELLAAHLAAYQSYFNRVALDLGDSTSSVPTDRRIQQFSQTHDPEFAALYYQFGRYLLISSSQPGGQPANLQGIWNDQTNPPWDSKYTININAEMNYWPAEKCNLSELHEPLLKMVEELSVSGRQTAATMYGADGWVAHHNTDIWRISGVVDGAFWGMWPMGGAWLSQHLWERYIYTGDREFLEAAYPILKSACEFYQDFLIEEPDHGWLVVSPSISPENVPAGRSTSVCAGATMDNQLLFDLFSKTIRAGELLGVDAALMDEFRDILERLPPMQIGKFGQLQEWLEDWDSPNDTHRHVSHLYGLFPSNQISPYASPELFDAARTSLSHRGDVSTGWSMGWKVNLWARLLDGEHALKLIKDQLRLVDASAGGESGGTYPNLFDAHPPFQIDGNFGCTSGIAEMLLQSHDGTVHVLPALPEEWSDAGGVKGLKAYGGFEVGFTWQAGQVDKLVVRSSLGGNCRLRVPNELVASDGSALTVAAGANPNPFFETASVQQPIVSPSAMLNDVMLEPTFVYDIPTEPGRTYVFAAK